MKVFNRSLLKSTIASAILLALSLSCNTAWGGVREEAKELNNKAVLALVNKDYDLAIKYLEEALTLDPSYRIARINLATAYNNSGLAKKDKDPAQALKYFHNACLIDPENVTSKTNLANIIEKMGKNPRDFGTRVALGDSARRSGDFTGAIVEYAEAVKGKPDAAVFEKLGDVRRIRDENDAAIAAYQSAAGIADSATIEVKLGQALQAKGDQANAFAAYGRATKMKPTDPDVLDSLGAGWEAVIKTGHSSPENYINYGQVLQYMSRYNDARAAYKQAIDLSPGKQNEVAEKLLQLLPSEEDEAQRNHQGDQSGMIMIDHKAKK